MSSRWEVPGNYFQDGIDYIECANRCRDRSDCAGFDIWEGNNDCQLFFDQEHYGDGASEEECFIKEGFVGEKQGFTAEEWEGMFDHYTNSRGYATFEEFTTGWKENGKEEADQKELERKIAVNFKFADKNADGQLSKEEFMALRTVVGSHYIDAFMFMDKNLDRKLSLDEFSSGYK